MIDTLQVHLTNEEIKTVYDYIKDYSFSITLIVGAFLGFILNRIYENISFKEKRTYFFHALFELKNALEVQLTLYNSYIDNLKDKKDHLLMLQTHVGFNLKNIELVSREIIYKIFVKKPVKRDRENLNRLTALTIGFNLIQHQSNMDEAQDDKIREINKKYLFQYREARKKIVKDIDMFISANVSSTDQDFIAFGEDYDNLVISYYGSLNAENKSIFYDIDNFINPLFNIVQRYGYIDFIHQISAMLHTVSELESNRNDAINKITDESNRLETVYKNIVDTLIIYNEFLDDKIKNEININPLFQTKMENENKSTSVVRTEEDRLILKKELEQEANNRKHESQSMYDKYLISLSTASLGFSVAFIKESEFIGREYKWILITSWAFFAITAIITLISFKTSANAYKKQLEDIQNIFAGRTTTETMPSSNKYTKFLNKTNIWIFIIGIILTFLYICLNLYTVKMADDKQQRQQSEKLSEGLEASILGKSIYELMPKQELDIIKKGLVANSLPIEDLKPPIENIPQNNSENKDE